MPDDTIMTGEATPTDTTAPETPTTSPATSPATSPDTIAVGSTPAAMLTPSAPIIVNQDGSFGENWRNALPEEIRGEECWDVVTDFGNMAKQFVNQRKAIGKDKVVLPGANATPEEKSAFYDSIGRPKTPADYKVDVPEEMSEFYTPEVVAEQAKLAHEIGATNEQFAAYMQKSMERDAQLIQQQAEARTQAVRSAEDTLRKEFGAAYDQRIHVANRLVSEALPNEEAQMDFIEKFGSDPDFIRFASVVGGRLVESKALVAELSTDTPGEAQKKINQLMATPGYMDVNDKVMSADQRQALTDQILDLKHMATTNPTRRVQVGLG